MIAAGCDDGTIKIFSSLGGAPKKTLKEHNARFILFYRIFLMRKIESQLFNIQKT
jgi:hypothetical protein